MRVVFMGTPDISATCLKKILADGFEVVGVYTQPDRPKGRGMKLVASPVKELALAQQEYIVKCRRWLHAHPEESCQEVETTKFIIAQLEEMGVPYITYEGCTGCVAVIEGAQPGMTVMLRADIDALPIQEDSGVEYASKIPGQMHACGHDAHTAMLLAVAKELKAMTNTELEAKVGELKAELFNLRFQLATGQLQNTTVIANTKRDIARCMTILRENELKDAQ